MTQSVIASVSEAISLRSPRLPKASSRRFADCHEPIPSALATTEFTLNPSLSLRTGSVNVSDCHVVPPAFLRKQEGGTPRNDICDEKRRDYA